MNSWDCFDTLIARKFITPESIFEEVGKRIDDPTFVQRRKLAEKNTTIKTYGNIYKNLSDVDSSIELDVEFEHVIPISKNIRQVENGDYVVSDMYLPKEFILKLLKKCGLTKKINLIVTPSGKKEGTVWNYVSNIDNHFGDNKKTDVRSPRKKGINGIHVTDSQLNEIEKIVYESNKNLASLMRTIRLSSPYDDEHRNKIWIDQANLNVPILILGSLALPNNKTICFNYRDCIYWRQIYTALFNKKSTVLHSSRKYYLFPTQEYKEYVASTLRDEVLVDLKGSGKSPNVFFKNKQSVIYLVGTKLQQPNKSLITPGKWKDAIERLNLPNIGPIVDCKNQKIYRGESEHDPEIVAVQEKAINYACELLNQFNFDSDTHLLEELVSYAKTSYTNKAVNTLYSTKTTIVVDGKTVNVNY